MLCLIQFFDLSGLGTYSMFTKAFICCRRYFPFVKSQSTLALLGADSQLKFCHQRNSIPVPH